MQLPKGFADFCRIGYFMEVFKYVVTAVCGYLLGSISFSIAISRLALGGDVRDKGSGNAGATNMARVFGMRAGVFTLFGDAAKAGISMLIGWFLLGESGLAVGALSCLLGHCFPLYYNLKGGKGVSAGAAVALAIDWRVFLVAAAAFALAVLLTRKVSLGSICASLSVAVSALLFNVPDQRVFLAIVAAALVIFQHRGNIKRLINNTEPDFRPAKAKNDKTF